MEWVTGMVKLSAQDTIKIHYRWCNCGVGGYLTIVGSIYSQTVALRLKVHGYSSTLSFLTSYGVYPL